MYANSEDGARRLLKDLRAMRSDPKIQEAEVRLWSAKFSQRDSPLALEAQRPSPPAAPLPARPAPPPSSLSIQQQQAQYAAAVNPVTKSVTIDEPPTRYSLSRRDTNIIDKIDNVFQSMIADIDDDLTHGPLSPQGWRARIRA
jgi:hypothetical protein